jgi:hypothetical protein
MDIIAEEPDISAGLTSAGRPWSPRFGRSGSYDCEDDEEQDDCEL